MAQAVALCAPNSSAFCIHLNCCWVSTQLAVSHRGQLPADASAEMSNRGFWLLQTLIQRAYMDAAKLAYQNAKDTIQSFLPPINLCKIFSPGNQSQHMNLAVKARPYPAGRSIQYPLVSMKKKNNKKLQLQFFNSPLSTPNVWPEPVF